MVVYYQIAGRKVGSHVVRWPRRIILCQYHLPWCPFNRQSRPAIVCNC